MKMPKPLLITVKVDLRQFRAELRKVRKELRAIARMFTKGAKRLAI
jgi:hypothetical protein